MRTQLKTLMAASLMAAFAAVPLGQATAQGVDASSGSMQSGGQTVPGKVDDAWITTKVKSEFATADGVDASDIRVDTRDGRVTLRGHVANANEKMQAERLARSVKGVDAIDSSGLMVGGNMSADRASSYQDASNTNDGRSMTGHAKDAWITTKVKSKFATADGVDATDINVDTRNGMVTLRGQVSSAAEIQQARKVAMSIEGVKSVDTNGLTIQSSQ